VTGYARYPLNTFPRNFPVSTGKLPSAELLATRQTILTCQHVANKSATSRNGIWETTRHNRQTQRTLPAPTCYGLAIRGNWRNGFWPLLATTELNMGWYTIRSVTSQLYRTYSSDCFPSQTRFVDVVEIRCLIT